MPRSTRSPKAQLLLVGLGLTAGAAWSRGFVAAGRPAPLQRARVARAAGDPAASTLERTVTGPATGDFTLRYFDGRGVAETARMLFAVAGKDFDDARYPISFGTPGDFSTLKREEFDADKAAGKMDVAMGKVPILEAGPDFRLPQSKAIERYLAKKLGLMGETLEEEAWVDAVAEHVRDINDAYNKKGLFFMKDEEKKAELQKAWFEEELPGFLTKLDAALPGTSVAVGEKPSLADVAIFKLLKDTYDRDISDVYADCGKLKAIVATMEEIEALQKWIESRPKTMF